jgi:hypothetical protein
MQGFGIVGLPKVGLASFLLIVGLFVSIARQKPFEGGRWKRHYSLVFMQFFFYPAIVAIGVLYRVSSNPTRPRPRVNPFADWTIDVLFFLSLALSFFWVYRMKNLRWLAFCLVSLLQLFLFGAMFVASMSITGDWL